MTIKSAFLVSSLVLLAGCPSSQNVPQKTPAKGKSADAVAQKATATKTLTIVGTSDLHGHIEMLPLFGGYIDILRGQKDRALVLVDGGDMFQGTLASNLVEGAPIVSAYNLLKYDAVTIGNHEFDFGPVGADATATKPGQDPRGALKARAASANFPFLSSNILSASGKPVSWPNVRPTTLVDADGISVGIIGISTYETPKVTLAANVVGLRMAPLTHSVAQSALALRKQGAQVVVVAAHAGGDCKEFGDPNDLHSCDKSQEIFEVANALPSGLVDVIVAGHTHRAVAHKVNGIAIIESYARGNAFGRVDLQIDNRGQVSGMKIHPPKALCQSPDSAGPGCDAGQYEGQKVAANAAIGKIAQDAAKVAEALRSKELGIELLEKVPRSRSEASPLGNLFADLILEAQPSADIAIVNGGSLRAELPKGMLRYGNLFEAIPFDNRFALVTMRGRELKKLLAKNLARDNGLLSISGMKASTRCVSGTLVVKIVRTQQGKKKSAIRDNELLIVATSDFLASGGDDLIGDDGATAEKVEIDVGLGIRDAMAEILSARGGTLDPAEKSLFDPKNPRLQYSGKRPLTCPQ